MFTVRPLAKGGCVAYRIEVAEFETRAWVAVGVVEQSLNEVKMYICVVKRLYPGCHVRALEFLSGEIVAEV